MGETEIARVRRKERARGRVRKRLEEIERNMKIG